MSVGKHTPGPWLHSHRQGSDRMYHTEVFSEEHGGIATCNWTPKHRGNGVTATYRESNARLIAAAPDLLAELKKAREHIKEHFDSFIECTRNPKTGLIDNPLDQIVAESDQDLLNSIDAAIAKAEAQP